MYVLSQWKTKLDILSRTGPQYVKKISFHFQNYTNNFSQESSSMVLSLNVQ